MRFRTITAAALAAIVFSAAPLSASFAEKSTPRAVAPETPDALNLIDVGTVVSAEKSDLIKLDNGKSYRLDQIRIPVLYDQPAADYLQASTVGKKVGIYIETEAKLTPADHSGNLYAHVMREDGTWVQADMVSRGLAWAFGSERSHSLVTPLYRYEIAARTMNAGFWSNPEYAIRTPNDIANYVSSYQLYQGVITNIRFGEEDDVFTLDSKTRDGNDRVPPLTFTIKMHNTKSILPPGLTLSDVNLKWLQAMVRVHGWVEKDPTSATAIPNINVTYLDQLEFLNPQTGQPVAAYSR